MLSFIFGMLVGAFLMFCYIAYKLFYIFSLEEDKFQKHIKDFREAAVNERRNQE